MAERRLYYVNFNEVAVVTEAVEASSKAEAIRLVKVGEGERVDFQIDEFRNPTNFRAYREDE
ncbi:hypothetical protein [Arthrobacter woluwensis]|uniref:Uncharacterized protein n=1 Tax=Arthrobacter woluwensis TaxID=156980 RepID=A0A1H4W935_9MICC|nr:hypothetical protein [Arthrobacter woluwensis]SEC89725.1 hypothetical protein SAMN04489745_3453 [Arthrobacter woluwensis]SEC95883.1 hypothetical protein SAMN04489745_3551 [Arthrobacter woluwensis]